MNIDLNINIDPNTPREVIIKGIRELEELIALDHYNIGHAVYDDMYGWQQDFNAATLTHTASMLMAANQVGKTQTGCCIDAFHLTGQYPDDWPGHKFDFPPRCWLLGYAGEKTRDLLQSRLFGEFRQGAFSGGFVPADLIIDHRSMPGTSGGVREVRIKHVMGTSVCQFWSYTQGQSALMGDIVDWFHIDEEPKDQTIYPQVLTRTINGDRGEGGRGILTFTPENGKTQLVSQFMGESVHDGEEAMPLEAAGMYMQNVTWKDCPHISPQQRETLLAQYPPYQRKMRSEGVPLMGSGLIYPFDEDDISFKPFDYPPHWWVLCGLDLGWDHPAAFVKILYDRETGVYYVIEAWKKSRCSAAEAMGEIREWVDGVPIAWPADGLQTRSSSRGGEVQKIQEYRAAGFLCLGRHAQFQNGSVDVWSGISQIYKLMESGQFKISEELTGVFAELRQYHTKTSENGIIDIVKKGDDFMDAMRYGYMPHTWASVPLERTGYIPRSAQFQHHLRH